MLSIVGIPIGVIFLAVSALLILQTRKHERSHKPRRLRQYASTWKRHQSAEIVEGVWTEVPTHENV